MTKKQKYVIGRLEVTAQEDYEAVPYSRSGNAFQSRFTSWGSLHTTPRPTHWVRDDGKDPSSATLGFAKTITELLNHFQALQEGKYSFEKATYS